MDARRERVRGDRLHGPGGQRARVLESGQCKHRSRRSCVSGRVEQIEGQFCRLLESLRPRPEYACLFRAVVIDVWKAESEQTASTRCDLERRVARIQEKLKSVDAAFVLERTIDERSYIDLRDQLRQDLAVSELALSEARIEQLDVEGVLAFAEHVIGNAAARGRTRTLRIAEHSRMRCFPQVCRGDQADLEPS